MGNRREIDRILAVAVSDYRLTVFSKAFVISLVLMPEVLVGAVAVQFLAREAVDLKDRGFVVVDNSGRIFEFLQKRAEHRNRHAVYQGDDGRRKQVLPRFLPVRFEGDGSDLSVVEGRLSEAVRKEEIFAFLVIDENTVAAGGRGGMSYYSASPAYMDLPDWLESSVNEHVRSVRFESAGISERMVNKLRQEIPFTRMKVVSSSNRDGGPEAEKADLAEAILIPFGAVMLLFVVANMSAPMMLNMVMEEKMQRIAEVLVASIPPFSLMAGKLLASCLVGLTYAVVYLGSIFAVLSIGGVGADLPFEIIPWFILFLILALIIFGSMWAGVGAACADIKDTQNFAGIAILMILTPMVLMTPVMQSPGSTLSVVASLIPPLTPFLMLLRMAMPPGPEIWEVVLGVALSLVFSVACVWVAGRIFRVGLLARGQTPTFRRLLSWVISG